MSIDDRRSHDPFAPPPPVPDPPAARPAAITPDIGVERVGVDLEDLRKPDLVSLARDLGLDPVGTRDVLIDRIRDART